MPTLIQLTTIVEAILQDFTYANSDITSIMNRGVQEIAGGMVSAFTDSITPPLPNLLSIGSIDTVTDAAYVSMPGTFQRKLQFAAGDDGVEIDIANSFIGFAADYPLFDRAGRINEVIEHGGNIYYQGIPAAAETVTIHFYRLPVDMEDATDEPDGIPVHLQEPLLVNYTCWELFKRIENGLEGPLVNTTRYKELFMEAMRTLELSVPFDTRSFFLL